MNQDRTARLCKCGCQAILLPQDSRDHASLECSERSRRGVLKREVASQGATDGDVWSALPPLAPVITFPKAWIARVVAEAEDDLYESQDSPIPGLRPAASAAQIRWSAAMIAQVPKKSPEQVARENNTPWDQLVYWAHSSTEGLPERAAKEAKASAKEPVKKSPAKTVTRTKAAPKAKAKGAKQAR